mmetsp:Transcript_14275/g.22746  ORF Transcript_14275/g.22746 Transcript_14275/m.22746 type:complete len:87 (-) Transcript_14275:625-885(-)
MKVLGEHKSQISSVRVDWAYALALSSRVSEPSSQQDASNTGKAEHEENLDEELQREIVHRVMRDEVAKLKQENITGEAGFICFKRI